MNVVPAPDISRAAARLFAQRQARAREMVRAGRMNPTEATLHLKPWLAIACLCGADLPELEEGLSDLRTVQVWPEQPGTAGVEISDGEARWLLADEICPRARWAPILARARDDALMGPLATDEQRSAAVALREVASHLGHDVNGRHPVPLFDVARAYDQLGQTGPARGAAA